MKVTTVAAAAALFAVAAWYPCVTALKTGLTSTAKIIEEEARDVVDEDSRIGRRLQVKPVSVVFIVDESGSMSSVQAALRTNIPFLFTALRTQAPGSKAGLIGYGGDSTDHPMTPHVHIQLTTDPAAFDNASQSLEDSGGTEPAYEAIIEAANGAGGNFTMGYTSNTGFCVALFTDEESNGDCASCTEAAAIDSLLNVNGNEANAKGVFFGVVTPGLEGSYEPIANATGGAMLSLADFATVTQPVLDALVAKCGFAVNQITLSPNQKTLRVGQVHTLTIGTNQLVGTSLVPQGNVPVTLVVENQAPPLSFSGKTKSNGTVTVLYDPSTDPTFNGGLVEFKACRTDVTPPACTLASVLYQTRNKEPTPSPAGRPSAGPTMVSSKSKHGKGMKGMQGKGMQGKGMRGKGMRGKGMRGKGMRGKGMQGS